LPHSLPGSTVLYQGVDLKVPGARISSAAGNTSRLLKVPGVADPTAHDQKVLFELMELSSCLKSCKNRDTPICISILTHTKEAAKWRKHSPVRGFPGLRYQVPSIFRIRSGSATFARILANNFSASISGYSARASSQRESRLARASYAFSGLGDCSSPSCVQKRGV
jgi:hypothetical protein